MFELLFQLLFWGGIVGLTLWLVHRDKQRNFVDYESKTYAQGYWDGYRAHQKEAGGAAPVEEVTAQPLQLAETAKPMSAEDKEARDLQNINLALYVASFLLVAAAALFIGTALPESVKFVGTWLITAAFYGGGLWLYGQVAKLRPAAVAFAGTGLALLPFTGIAMYNFVLPDAALCWLVTSLIGVAAFVYATIRLQSQVVAYFAIAFMVSLASASVATVGAGLIWYFVVLIAFGSLVTVAAKLRPTWLPPVFATPIQQSSLWIVPLTLAASLLAGAALRLLDYEIITAVAAVYYGAVAYSVPAQRRDAFFVARALASIFALLVAYDIANSWTAVGVAATIVGGLQAAGSALLQQKWRLADPLNEAWLWIGLGLQAIAPLFVLAGDMWALTVSSQLAVAAVTSVGLALWLRRSLVVALAVYAGLLLPAIFVGVYLELEPQWTAAVYVLMSATMVAVRYVFARQYPSLLMILTSAYALYVAASLLVALTATTGWTAIMWTLAAAVMYGVTMVERRPWLVLVGNGLLLGGFAWLLEHWHAPVEWRGLAVAWLAFVAFYGAYWLLQTEGKYQEYARNMLWTGLGVAGVLALLNLDVTNFDAIVAAGLTVVVVALAVAMEGENQRLLGYYDAAAILATIGLQRIVTVAVPGLDGLVYSHWWVAVLAGLAYMYYRARQREAMRQRLVIGLVIFSFFSGLAALGGAGDAPYRLIFLLEHAILLIAGLMLSYKLVSIWGAVGVVLAVMWLLSGYTFLLLTIIALALIGGAVYALLGKSHAK